MAGLMQTCFLQIDYINVVCGSAQIGSVIGTANHSLF